MLAATLISATFVITGLVLWSVAARRQRRDRKVIVMSPESEALDRQYLELRVRLIEFSRQIGGLPALPDRPIDYEGWLQDVKKRIEMRSERRTLSEHVETVKRFNDLHAEWLRLAQLRYELGRVGARGAVEDAKIQLELKQIAVENAKLDQQLRELTSPKPPPPAPPTDEQRIRQLFRRANTIAMLNRVADEEIARYDDDPGTQDIIRRIRDDERQRILEGRR